ncbi:PucR family transcriptional regulator ligand-binding domain-containing protein [Streptomyces sp. NPDC014636]|uniref:PucR family transcriptional regulator ligand-binding domain-containing protein n=1 Tax=Streptomyces sp. NPDC014636 TaxID=3364876 RepID=UPI0036F51774
MEGTHTMPETIAPAVPPTPPVALQALLAREDLALRQIAGPAGPETVIHWAHTSEMADPYPYLLGGELLLTAGVHVPETAVTDTATTGTDTGTGTGTGTTGTEATGTTGTGTGTGTMGTSTYFDDYVSRIVAAGGAALGFGVAPVHDTVPRALVAACDRHGLPLLEVPPQTTFSGVARAVWQLMAQARLAELRRVTEAQQSLAAAASRPDPVPSVLRQLAQRLGGRAVLYGPDGTEVAAAGRETPEGAGAALAELAAVVRPTAHPDRSTTAAPTTSTAGPQRTPAPPATRPQPSSTTPPTAPTAGPQRTTAPPPVPTARPQRATAAPTTPTAPAAPGPRPQPGSSAPVAVGRPQPTSATDAFGDAHLAVYALGAGEGFVLGVATSRREPGDHTIASVASVLLALLTGEHHSGAGAARSSALVRLLLGAPPDEVAPLLGTGRWLVVHARPETQAPDPVAASALGAALGSALVDLGREVVRVLVPADRDPAPQPGWTVGVSAPAEPHDWPAADTQAARALARARATRAPLLRHAARPALADLVPRADAETHARTLLAPLAAQPALAETLRTWLSLHGSWDRTAVALGVHRNTVRQRIARCAAQLAADLDDPDVRMELWFALRRG